MHLYPDKVIICSFCCMLLRLFMRFSSGCSRILKVLVIKTNDIRVKCLFIPCFNDFCTKSPEDKFMLQGGEADWLFLWVRFSISMMFLSIDYCPFLSFLCI